MSIKLPSGYQLRQGLGMDRALLVKFMQLTYQELFPNQNFFHLAETVDQYFSKNTPLWFVESIDESIEDSSIQNPKSISVAARSAIQNSVVGCLWLGNAIDQAQGDRHTHIFLLYVTPEHRHCGIGTALMQYAESWAITRGDRQIGLQVFEHNQNALRLYHHLGYKTQSLWMVKPLNTESSD